MKAIKAIGCILLAVAVACTPATPQKRAFQTLSTIQVSVKTAMNVYGDLYRAGYVTIDQEQRIDSLYGKYQKAALTAANGLKLWQDTGSGDTLAILGDVTEVAKQLVALVDSLKARPPTPLPTPTITPQPAKAGL